MKEKVESKLKEIADCICKKINDKPVDYIGGLYDGEFGPLLFLYYYAKYIDNSLDKIVESYTENLVNNINSINRHTFCSGLSGILYLFELLREEEFIDIDLNDVEKIFDNYMIQAIKGDISNKNFDLLHGSLGVLIYFLKKNTNKNLISNFIDKLFEAGEINNINHTVKWKSAINIENKFIYNISLSHGMSGIALFLSRAIEKNISVNKTMFEGIINYLLSQEMDHNLYGSCFPSFSIEHPNPETLKSRLGWCYGDLGIGYTIWFAGKINNQKKWQEKGLGILLKTTERKPSEEESVVDAGICHGSAGIAMFYKKIYDETNHEEFKYAYTDWINKTLKLGIFSNGLAGYKSQTNEEWVCDSSLLSGISGIGLVLISYLFNDKQKWDQLFLL